MNKDRVMARLEKWFDGLPEGIEFRMEGGGNPDYEFILIRTK